jgi:hypothetical protein
MIDEITKDWEWLSFLARYCAGKNIAKAFCDDVKWWALGVGALVIVLVVWWIFGRLARAYGNWSHRRLSARIADDDTMKKHVWAGHDAHLTSSDQRANRKSGK